MGGEHTIPIGKVIEGDAEVEDCFPPNDNVNRQQNVSQKQRKRKLQQQTLRIKHERRGELHTGKCSILRTLQAKGVTTISVALGDCARREGHVGVEPVETFNMAVFLHPLAEEGPDVGEKLAVGVNGEGALLLARW